MASKSVLNLQQSLSTSTAAQTLCWQMAAGRALQFQADKAMELQIAQGRVWATLDGPHAGAANDWGDLVLRAGDRFTLQRGQRIVLESWSEGASGGAARLVWSPAAQAVSAPSAAWWAVGSAFPAWLAQTGRLAFARVGRAAGLGRLGAQSRLQCQPGPGGHGVG